MSNGRGHYVSTPFDRNCLVKKMADNWGGGDGHALPPLYISALNVRNGACVEACVWANVASAKGHCPWYDHVVMHQG